MFAQSNLMELIDVRQKPCVSLYMPTHRAGSEQREDEIRLRNLLREAQEQFTDLGYDAEETRQVLKPVEELPRREKCWQHRGDGVAIFSTIGSVRCFSLPASYRELVFVDDHFHISPLVSMLGENRRFFILALTKDTADLYEATRNSLAECRLGELIPIVMDGAEQTLQTQVDSTPPAAGADSQELNDIENFFKQQVEPEVSAFMRKQGAPLVLACVSFLAPLYTRSNSYEHLIEGHVSGSPAELDEEMLLESAWQLVVPSFAMHEKVARRKYGDLSESERTLAARQPILEAARRGRIEILFVDKYVAARAASGSSNGQLSAADYDAVEEAVEWTIRNGGEVLTMDDVPGKSNLAAVLRY